MNISYYQNKYFRVIKNENLQNRFPSKIEGKTLFSKKTPNPHDKAIGNL